MFRYLLRPTDLEKNCHEPLVCVCIKFVVGALRMLQLESV